MEIQAKYFEILSDKKVKCTLCPHECILRIGQTGICHVRKNIDGNLISLAYSNPCAVNIDPIEKKPLYHFLPGTKTFSIATAGCNLSCKNCQNFSISQVGPTETSNYYLQPHEVVKNALENNCQTISYTYTEPLVFFEYTLDTAKIAHKNNLKNILVSAGYINPEPLKEIIPFIDAANIDLKSFDENIYKKISSAKLKPVLETLLNLKKNNVWLEITNLIIPGHTDNFEMIERMTKWLFENGFEKTPIHFSKFYPVYKLSNERSTPDSSIEKAIEIAEKNGLKFIYSGNIRGHKNENTFCTACHSILIERDGFKSKIINLKEGKCKICEEKIDGIW